MIKKKWIVVLVVLFVNIAFAQVPQNADSISAAYSRELAKGNTGDNVNFLAFKFEVNGIEKKKYNRYKYGYLIASGGKTRFPLNRKNRMKEKISIPKDSLRLFFSYKKDSIFSNWITKEEIEKGGTLVFGMVDDYIKQKEKYDTDNDFQTEIMNSSSAYSLILSKDNIKTSYTNLSNAAGSKLYYCVFTMGVDGNIGTVRYNYYFK